MIDHFGLYKYRLLISYSLVKSEMGSCSNGPSLLGNVHGVWSESWSDSCPWRHSDLGLPSSCFSLAILRSFVIARLPFHLLNELLDGTDLLELDCS